jgi:hypothetical protein
VSGGFGADRDGCDGVNGVAAVIVLIVTVVVGIFVTALTTVVGCGIA